MLLFYYGTGKNNELTKQESLFSADPKFFIKMPSGENAPVFDFQNFPFEIFTGAPLYKKCGKTRDNIFYYNLVCSFDIETTTIDIDKPFAFMYQWQMAIEDYVFMGKTWEEFQDFLNKLHAVFNINIQEHETVINGKTEKILEGRSLVFYVFNLQFEFMFCQHFIGELVSPLFTNIYEPLILPCANGISFRCAYRLTNKSLEVFTKGFPHAKLAGDLDYKALRTPVLNDPKNGLTDLELAYCFNDVKGLNEALRDRLEKDKQYNIATIPLTSTGYVRKDCMHSMRKDPKCRAKFLDLKLTPHLYELCRKAFRGGNTHANAAFSGRTVGTGPEFNHIETGLIHHKDITSSYPAQILTKPFPRTPFTYVKEWACMKVDPDYMDKFKKNLDDISSRWCILFSIRLIGVKYIADCGVPYIATAKTITRTQDETEILEDNGRIYEAPYIKLACTEIDLKLILEQYSIEEIHIIEAWKSKKAPLPYELRRVCLDYYKRKTLLKGSEDPTGAEQYEYNRCKELLNAIYGLLCTRIDRVQYEYDHGNFTEVIRPLPEMLEEFYDSDSSFLPYQYAIWVTSWARYELDRGCKICGPDLLYTDTDSVFYIGDHEKEFEELNNQIAAEAYKVGAVAANKAGKEFPIGVWSSEHDAKFFRTLGAKKYLLSYDGKTIESTISGVSKDIGKEFFTKHGFDAFNNDTVIPVSGKVSAHYNNDLPHYIEINGTRILTASNVALIEAPYTVKVTTSYKEFISLIRKRLELLKQLK